MLFSLTLAIGMTSCKDDDDDEEAINNSIIGIWADMAEYEEGDNEVFCLRINDDYQMSEMIWNRRADTFRYESDDNPYSSILKKEGDAYLAYDYENGERLDCTYTVSGDLLYDTHPKGSVYTFKRIR